MKKIKLFCAIWLMGMVSIMHAATQEERIAELERIALYEQSDVIEDGEVEIIPTPADAKKKFNLTDAQLFEDIMNLANKYSLSETNNENRICR